MFSSKALNRFFHLQENHTNVKREILAGLTTFSTMAYALILIPTILSETGMDFGAVMSATLISAAFATLLMGLWANYPFALAPGLAICVYFTYAVVLARGQDWHAALGVVFLCGALFLILNLLHIRQLIIEAIPLCLRIATTGGLGLFLALIGLRNAGVIVSNPKTLLSFGDPTAPATIMTGIGFVVMAVLLSRRIPGAIFIGILVTWVCSLAMGISEFEGFASWPASLAPTFFTLKVRAVSNIEMLSVFVSFIFVSLFDTSGTLIGLAEEADFLRICPTTKKKCIFPRISQTLTPDAVGSMLASFLGTTTMAVYLESAAGIEQGGRTGLTSVVVGFLFLVALFFTPFAASIPLFATSPALMIVGGLMLKQVAKLNWRDPSEWIPGFATLVLIPLTYSVAIGIAVGFIVYPLIKLFSGKWREVHWLAWILCVLFLFRFAFLPIF